MDSTAHVLSVRLSLLTIGESLVSRLSGPAAPRYIEDCIWLRSLASRLNDQATPRWVFNSNWSRILASRLSSVGIIKCVDLLT